MEKNVGYYEGGVDMGTKMRLITISDEVCKKLEAIAKTEGRIAYDVLNDTIEEVFTKVEEKNETEIRIFIRTSFPAYHRWMDASEEYKYLSNYHRHLFYVEMSWEVFHSDREIEFIEMKNKVDAYINKYLKNRYFEYSCEKLANILQKEFRAKLVVVSEDDENGAVITKR